MVDNVVMEYPAGASFRGHESKDKFRWKLLKNPNNECHEPKQRVLQWATEGAYVKNKNVRTPIPEYTSYSWFFNLESSTLME